MKTIFCVLFVTSIFMNANAQYPVDSVCANFDIPDTIVFIQDSSSIWQIGKPNKTFFLSSYNSDNSIVTDTVNPYPINDTSSFYAIYHPEWVWDYLSWYLPFQIDFYHRFNTDTINDFGLIELSINGGSTWLNCLTNEYNFYDNPDMNSHEIINTGEKLYDSLKVTGNSNGWIHSIITKDIGMWNYNYWDHSDSIIVKFSFHSDNVQNPKDGWQIDNLCIGQVLVPVSIKPNFLNTNIIIQNNEALRQFVFKILDGQINQIKIYDSKGNLILEDSPNTSYFNLNMSKFSTGIYFYSVTSGHELYNGKFAVSN